MFDALEMSHAVMDQLASVEPKIRTRRKSLADQIGRAAESICLNLAGGRMRAGLDQRDRVARSRGYIGVADHAAVDAPLDRVRAMLWRLTH